jgi:predicted TIM-barrel fold metal-dependent hydrolase
MIVDSHLHIFPFLDGLCGFPTRRAHLEYLQFYMVGHGQPVRRLRDHAIVPGGSQLLHHVEALGPEGLADVNFRVERNGRFVWTQDGEDRYIHFMPPSLQTNEATPEEILAQIAYVGVDVGVLQNAHLYGRLDDEFAAALRAYPGKFVGLAEVEEFNAHTDEELHSLQHAARVLGFKGLYYANRSFLWDHYEHTFDDTLYDNFWSTVADLDLVVFWELAGIPYPTEACYLREVDRLVRLHERFPTLRSILTHGLSADHILSPPEPVERLLRHERITIEVLFPIYWGRNHDYPYLELRPVLGALIRQAGAARLCWGSDLPNVERNCTYRQSLDYLPRCLNAVKPRELDLILGDNVAEILKIAPS